MPTRLHASCRLAGEQGIDAALGSGLAPAPSAAFTRTTFDFIASGKPHAVAAALALGREHVIPSMFRAFLSRMAVTEAQAPSFHYYLNRHVHLDEDFHAPLSLRLLAACAAATPANGARPKPRPKLQSTPDCFSGTVC